MLARSGGEEEEVLLKDRKKVKGQNFPPVEPEEHIFWSKFGGIALIPPAPVEDQVVPPGG